MELDLQSLFGLLCTAVLIRWDFTGTAPPPPHLGSYMYTRALLVSQARRHLFVTPWDLPSTWTKEKLCYKGIRRVNPPSSKLHPHRLSMYVASPESIEWFIEDQAFFLWLHSAPLPRPPISKLSLFLGLPLCRRSSLLTGEGGQEVCVEQYQTTARKHGPLYCKSFNPLWSTVQWSHQTRGDFVSQGFSAVYSSSSIT
jgi:hypothetical protein